MQNMRDIEYIAFTGVEIRDRAGRFDRVKYEIIGAGARRNRIPALTDTDLVLTVAERNRIMPVTEA